MASDYTVAGRALRAFLTTLPRLYNPDDPRVLNSYLSIEIAAWFSSVRTRRPIATSLRGSVSLSCAGQLTASSTRSPSGSAVSVVNRTPPLLILTVLPVPTCLTVFFPPSTLYRTSRSIGSRLEERRSSLISARLRILFDICHIFSRVDSFDQ